MSRFFLVGSIAFLYFTLPITVLSGPRDTFAKDKLYFLDFQNPSPDIVFSEEDRILLKKHFLTMYNRTLALTIRLEHIAERIENAIALRELASDTEQIRIKLAYARTRLSEVRRGLDEQRNDFEKIFVLDARQTVRSRMHKMEIKFEKEVSDPLRVAHSALISIVFRLKEHL